MHRGMLHGGVGGLARASVSGRGRRLVVLAGIAVGCLWFVPVAAARYGPPQTIGSGYRSPFGVAVDSAGDVFVADFGNNEVEEVTPGGTQTTIGSGFSYPEGVAVDAVGDVFVADGGNSRVEEVMPGGTQTTIGSGFRYAYGVAVDSAGDVFVADSGNNQVKEVTPGGTQTTTASGFSHPQGVAVDSAGDVFVADTFNNQVVKVTPGGTQTTIGSGFSSPGGVAVDSAGDVFVADSGNSRVVEVTPGGTQTTIGSGFLYPQGVAVDSAGDVFVADYGNNRVVELPVIGPVSAAQSTISANPSSIAADGSTASTITVQAKDANGNDEMSGGANVVVSTTVGTVSSVTDNGDGTYSATLTSTQSGTADVSATINGQPITSGDASVTITPVPASGSTSTITADPTTVSDNGTAAATITVQAKDANGNDETTGGQTVVLHATLGKLSAVTDQGNGTYTATLTSTRKGTADISAKINGQTITSGDAHVAFVKPILPRVTGISPASGPVSGGTQITITGTGFTSGATVVIGQGYGPNTGTIAATDVKFVSSTELTATTGPQAKAGRFKVFVTTASGTGASQAADRFIYTKP